MVSPALAAWLEDFELMSIFEKERVRGTWFSFLFAGADV